MGRGVFDYSGAAIEDCHADWSPLLTWLGLQPAPAPTADPESGTNATASGASATAPERV
jgi:hypothetical protein